MPTSTPNVLVIHTDQHRADCLGCNGNPDVRTPAIDGLAGDGIVYENCFCSYPVCTPSRYSLLSGRYVHEHSGWTNRCTLPPGTPTFASELRQQGYRTTAIGKMHFTPTYLDVGFDNMLLAEQDGPGRWDDDYHRYLMALGLSDTLDLMDQRREFRERATQEYWETFGALVSNLPEEHHSTTWIGDRAMEELEGWAEGGTLLMVGFIKPHHPFDPPAPWHEMYDPDALTILPGWTDECLPRDLALSAGYFPHERLSPQAIRRVMAYYYATISQIDHHVGRMLDLLRRRGLYDDTLIVFTSDHGDYMGYHHLVLKGNHMYDPLARVPLIVKPPSAGRHGREPGLVSNVDVAPTILRAAGLQPPKTVHGIDLLAEGVGRDVVFSEVGRGHHTMARTATRKYLATGQDTGLLFDLDRDPHELVDVSGAAEYAADLVHLRTRLAEWRGPNPLPDTCLDLNAPIISGPNVPPADLSHRAKVIEYYGGDEGL